jgi:hypothetical protein
MVKISVTMPLWITVSSVKFNGMMQKKVEYRVMHAMRKQIWEVERLISTGLLHWITEYA